ncbi:YcxB family protein [Lacinutrix sp. Hel_I_90]|uniref:YcxB family protein n=1 Tax=Lacinutrix sp. Hel_I_90 TaxID=1249999 RepID=UPI0005C82944|nr:YcxB family protein [Lacinutrix sp. Hel_I_90]
MKLEYILEEKDFIDYHLFSISENRKTRKLMNTTKYILVGVFLFIGMNMYNRNNVEFAIILGIAVILTLFFFDKLYKSKLRNHFSKIVKNNYSKNIGEKQTMEFTAEYLITEDKTGEGKTKISETEQIDETQNNFFIKLSNGSSFVVSKNGIDNLEQIKKKWNELNIPISENLDWEWK